MVIGNAFVSKANSILSLVVIPSSLRHRCNLKCSPLLFKKYGKWKLNWDDLWRILRKSKNWPEGLLISRRIRVECVVARVLIIRKMTNHSSLGSFSISTTIIIAIQHGTLWVDDDCCKPDPESRHIFISACWSGLTLDFLFRENGCYGQWGIPIKTTCWEGVWNPEKVEFNYISINERSPTFAFHFVPPQSADMAHAAETEKCIRRTSSSYFGDSPPLGFLHVAKEDFMCLEPCPNSPPSSPLLSSVSSSSSSPPSSLLHGSVVDESTEKASPPKVGRNRLVFTLGHL